MDNHIPTVVEFVADLDRVVAAGHVVVQTLDFVRVDIFILDFAGFHWVRNVSAGV